MQVIIDGVEYVAVTGKRVNVDGISYAEIAPPQNTTRIVDGDGDEWHRVANADQWAYKGMDSNPADWQTRSHILGIYGIRREY